MKRILLTLLGTVAGLVSLLSFKTSQPLAQTGALPAAGVTSGDTPASTSRSTHRVSTHAPKHPPRSTPTSPSSPSPSTSSATPESYVGSAVDTQYGVVQVKVTVAGTRITHVAFVQLTAFDPRSQQINTYAAPRLLHETLSAQSARIDTITGASYTSAGYEQSLQSALDSAGI